MQHSSQELEQAAAEVVRRGWRWRDQVSTVFLAFSAVFVGNAIASLLSYLADGDAKRNSEYTAIGAAVGAAVVLAVLLYRWAGWDWARRSVQLVATYAAPLLEIMLALLLVAAINQGWDYGTAANVIANSTVIVGIAVVDVLFHLFVNHIIYQRAVDLHLRAWSNKLSRDNAEGVVSSWMFHEQLKTKIYPTLSLFNMHILEPAPPLSVVHR